MRRNQPEQTRLNEHDEDLMCHPRNAVHLFALPVSRPPVGECAVSRAPQFQWTSAARTHEGLVRAINEDACLSRPEHRLWAVADGMGGHAVGDFASRLVIDGLSRIGPNDDLAAMIDETRERLHTANRLLRTEAVMRDVPIIGSTVVVLLANGWHCACLWAGDSRIYLFRSGTLRQLTRDHNKLEELKAQGLQVEEYHVPRNLITRAVGAAETLEVDETVIEVFDGDVFLLCSDGLTNELSDADIAQALIRGHCEQAADELLRQALERGGHDNVSVIVVRADDPSAAERTLLNPAL